LAPFLNAWLQAVRLTVFFGISPQGRTQVTHVVEHRRGPVLVLVTGAAMATE